MLTPIPPAGSKWRGSTAYALFTELRPIKATKSTDQSVNNVATLTDDNALFVALPANAGFDFELHGIYTANTTPDFFFGWSYPAGLTMRAALSAIINGAGGVYTTTAHIETSLPNLEGSGSDRAFHIWGSLTTGVTAGTLRFRWAQLAANVSDTFMRAGSYLTVRQTS